MLTVALYFHVHQPYRLKRYSIFDIGQTHDYFSGGEDATNNERIFRKVVDKCYRPAGTLFLELLKAHPELKLSFSFTGTVLEQFEKWAPDVLAIYREMVKTGRVEIVGETYHHSLAYFYSREEFELQVKMHEDAVGRVFGVKPTAFRNTELAYTNSLAEWAAAQQYKAVLLEGWEPVLRGSSPNFLYKPPAGEIALLTKNYKLADDLAFRFHDRGWNEWPLTADKFAHWIHAYHGSGDIVNIFLDYETFGEHKWDDTGIFDFLKALPEALKRHPDTQFTTPSEAAGLFKPKDVLDIPQVLTWADTERDLSAWMGNDLQRSTLEDIYALESRVKALDDGWVTQTWRRLQTSDHFYYMCTKWWGDGDIHSYFSPYASPYEAYMTYRNALADFLQRLEEREAGLRGTLNNKQQSADL